MREAVEAMKEGIAAEGGFRSHTFPENLAQAALAALTASGYAVVPVEALFAIREAIHDQDECEALAILKTMIAAANKEPNDDER
jgi:hypothetical protein